jgi:hypothetical protein
MGRPDSRTQAAELSVGGPRPAGRAPWGYWTPERIIAALVWWHGEQGVFPAFHEWRRGGHPQWDSHLLPPASVVHAQIGWQVAKDQAASSVQPSAAVG